MCLNFLLKYYSNHLKSLCKQILSVFSTTFLFSLFTKGCAVNRLNLFLGALSCVTTATLRGPNFKITAAP